MRLGFAVQSAHPRRVVTIIRNVESAVSETSFKILKFPKILKGVGKKRSILIPHLPGVRL